MSGKSLGQKLERYQTTIFASVLASVTLPGIWSSAGTGVTRCFQFCRAGFHRKPAGRDDALAGRSSRQQNSLPGTAFGLYQRAVQRALRRAAGFDEADTVGEGEIEPREASGTAQPWPFYVNALSRIANSKVEELLLAFTTSAQPCSRCGRTRQPRPTNKVEDSKSR